MDTTRTLALVALTSLFYATPGPATLSLALSGSSFGVRRSVPYLTGILVGLMSNLVVAGLGLAVVFTRYPTVGMIFRYASLVYVLYLATKLFRPAHAAGESRRVLVGRHGVRRAFVRGALPALDRSQRGLRRGGLGRAQPQGSGPESLARRRSAFHPGDGLRIMTDSRTDLPE